MNKLQKSDPEYQVSDNINIMATFSPIHKIKVYEVRLRSARRPLELAEPILSRSTESARAFHQLIGLTDREQLGVLFINNNNRVVGAHIVAIGSQAGIAGIDAMTVFRAAILSCATAVVLGHNHPSGDPKPSQVDLSTTAKLIKAGHILGINIVDHVIVTREAECYHSMLDAGTLDFNR
jgi:DNA repair protein RadC